MQRGTNDIYNSDLEAGPAGELIARHRAMRRESEGPAPRGSRDLIEALEAINAERHQRGTEATLGGAVERPASAPWAWRAIETAGHRLAVYGSLAPGETNHHAVELLGGSWRRGTVRGKLHPRGATRGFPALVWDPVGEPVEVQLLETPALEAAWHELDAFEGEAYLRILVPVDLRPDPEADRSDRAVEIVVANLYALRPRATDRL
jgi:gamma-glutamylcyclotransferase (GGCT)/AIG2-like uncharacterized protein YtfP